MASGDLDYVQVIICMTLRPPPYSHITTSPCWDLAFDWPASFVQHGLLSCFAECVSKPRNTLSSPPVAYPDLQTNSAQRGSIVTATNVSPMPQQDDRGSWELNELETKTPPCLVLPLCATCQKKLSVASSWHPTTYFVLTSWFRQLPAPLDRYTTYQVFF